MAAFTFWSTLIFFASICRTASAFDIAGQISWNDVCPDPLALGHAKVVLDTGKHSASITYNGTFLIPSVPPGIYALSVRSHDHLFDNLRVDILESSANPEVRPHIPGTPMDPPSTILLSYPITLTPRAKLNYFVPPQSFNLLGMLSNPMMLMMIFAGGMVFAMPYLMKNMDPESLEEFKEQQAKMANLQSAMASGDLKSGLNALINGGEEPVVAAAAPPINSPQPAKASANLKNRNAKNKKR